MTAAALPSGDAPGGPRFARAALAFPRRCAGKCVVTNLPRALPRRILKTAGDARRAFCGVSAAAPKQASCAASPAARPWPLPGRLGRPLCGMGKLGKSKVEGREGRASSRPQWPGRSRALPSKNFPTRRRRFPNLMRRGEVARSGCGRMMLASMRRHPGRWLAQRDGAPVS